jgi:hypothetical protein
MWKYRRMKSDPVVESFSRRPKYRQDIAVDYGISVETLRRRLRKAKIWLQPGLIYPRHLRFIYHILGPPLPTAHKKPQTGDPGESDTNPNRKIITGSMS